MRLIDNLKDRKMAEYYLIGTPASITFALLVGIVVRAKPILSTPIPGIIKIGGENLFIYRSKDEFVEEIKKIMDNPRTYRIEMEKYSWKSKAREFEDLLEGVVIRGVKDLLNNNVWILK